MDAERMSVAPNGDSLRTDGVFAGVLDELGIERYPLADNSMGGAVCALCAAAHLERTPSSLALFSPDGVFRYSSPAKGRFLSS